MAEDFLEERYREAALYADLRQAAEWIWAGNGLKAIELLNTALPLLMQIAEKYEGLDKDGARALSECLEQILSYKGDLVRLGDRMEAGLMPLLLRYMECQEKISVDDGEGLCLESAYSGFLTVRETETGTYWHSGVDPMWEARKVVEHFYDPKKKSYSLLGSGLGYIAYQLYLISDGSISINLFEAEEKMIRYARSYGVLDWIPEECLHVVIDKDILPFLESAADETVGFHIFSPSLRRLPEKECEILKAINISRNSQLRLDGDRERNFYRNISNVQKWASELKRKDWGDEFIVVAAGPSVDDNLEFLREWQGRRKIIVINTVFSKILHADIRPDLVVVLDPQKRTMEHIEGLEGEMVPMLIGTTAYWGFGAKYRGEKYLIAENDAYDLTRQYADACGEEILRCKGTVTSLAFHVAAYLGAKAIYLVGADFAYPGGVTYAQGIADREVVDTSGYMEVESVGGGIVYTDNLLNFFRQELEDDIEKMPDILFFNMSRNGARIHGAKEVQTA